MKESTTGNLVWMDLEMTGLEPDRDVIIEIATVITDPDLNIVAVGPDLVIGRDAALFDTMDDWNKTQHTKSGLWQQVIASHVSESEAETQTLAFIQQFTTPQSSPLCGNSIWQDRRFLYKYMPTLSNHLHYRMVDVSTVKELAGRWFPNMEKLVKKKNTHRAYDDIVESIEELRFYRKQVFK